MNFIHEYNYGDADLVERALYQIPTETSVELSNDAMIVLNHRYQKDFVIEYILLQLKAHGSAITFFGSFNCFDNTFIYQSFYDSKENDVVITIDILSQNRDELSRALKFYCDGYVSTFFFDDGEA